MGVWFATLLAFGLMSGPPQGSVRSELDALNSKDSSERFRAQVWLLEHLNSLDAELVWQAALSNDLEGRYALAHVLAGHPRHFGLCAEALLHGDPKVQEVGGWAIEQRALAWNPALTEPPRRIGDLPKEWVEIPSLECLLQTREEGLFGGLVHGLRSLERELPLPIELVLDPDLDPTRSLAREPLANVPDLLTGPWWKVLEALVRAHRATWDVWGWRPRTLDESTEVPPRPFLRVRRAGKLQSVTGPALLRDWVRDAAQTNDRKLARASANALAECGWPDALAWLEAECMKGRSEFWQALAIAAERGRVARVWTTPQGLENFLQALSSVLVLEAGEARELWAVAARALQQAPSFVGDEIPLAKVLLAKVTDGETSARWTWLACAAYVGRGVADPDLAACAWSALRDGSNAPELRVAALLALASMRVQKESGMLRGSGDLLADLAPSLAEKTISAAEVLGLAPDPNRSRVSSVDALTREALWWATLSDLPRASAQLEAALSQPDAWQNVLRVLRTAASSGRKPAIERTLQALSAAPGGARWAERLGFGLGFGTRIQAEARLSALLAEGAPRGREEWLDVAYLIQWDRLASRVRGALVGALGQEVPAEALEPALWAAMDGLRAKRLPVQLEDFDGDLRRAANRAQHPLAQLLLDWNGGLRRGPSPGEPLGAGQLSPPK